MENKIHLIDANQLIKRLEIMKPDTDGITIDGIIRALKEPSTVDAVEVVHGRWILNDENECWVCSNCEMSALNNYRGNSTESNYCPNCGAKMDGGNEDG